MKWSLFATLGLAFCGGGCSTVNSGSATSTSSREWLAEHAKWNMSARYDDGASERVFVAGDLQTDAELRKEGGAIVRLESVRKVIAVDHARGALDGLPAGAIAGFLSGLGVTLAIQQAVQADQECSQCGGPGAGTVFAGAGVGLLIGAAVSAAIGAIMGHTDVLELK
jgi:hypothetical protein